MSVFVLPCFTSFYEPYIFYSFQNIQLNLRQKKICQAKENATYSPWLIKRAKTLSEIVSKHKDTQDI